MSGTGYTIKNAGSGNSEPIKTYDVVPADGTIAVERTEADNVVEFAIKTTYDGYETIDAGSPNYGGYFRAIHIKFNEENRRYRLVCILNGGSYTPVAKDFAFYYIKFGWKTGGENADHWYIEEFSRQGNGAYVALEQISKSEYNVLIHTPTGYAYANIGILKEDKEADVTIEHFNPQRTRYTPTGTIITTEIPNWKNGSPAVWSVIPEVQNPVIGQLGHYYNGDRNLYFYDGYNWHNVYSLAQGVASMLATTDRPASADNGTIYFDTTEQNLKIFYGGEWLDILSIVNRAKVVDSACHQDTSIIKEGALRNVGRRLYVCTSGSYQLVYSVIFQNGGSLPGYKTGLVYLLTNTNTLCVAGVTNYGGKWCNIRLVEKAEQIISFTNYSGETIAAIECEQIIVTNSFGSVSILDFSNIIKEEGKTIEINILSGSIIRVKDGSTEIDLNGCNESVVKAICLNNSWSFYKVSGITPVQ
jgi:hypothetical protein